MWGVFMFGVLKIEKRKKGFVNSLKYILNKPSPSLQKITVKNGAPFFILTLTELKDGEIDCEEVYRILGRCAKRLVIGRDTEIPETDYVGVFKPTLLPYLMLFNSAVKLSASFVGESHTGKLTACVIDENGILKERIIPLISLFDNIKIITDKPRCYDDVSEKILDEWGLPILITDNYDSAADCDFIFSPFKVKNAALSNCAAIRNHDSGALTRFWGEGITLPPDYSSFIPENVDPIIFASALYELCGVNALASLCFDKMKKI